MTKGSVHPPVGQTFVSAIERGTPRSNRVDDYIAPRQTRMSVPPSARGAGRQGFTLVEVLAALVILGIVLPVAMRGVSLSLAAASNAKHMNVAAQLADQKLNEVVLTSGWQQN